jgi:hypothetical protein
VSKDDLYTLIEGLREENRVLRREVHELEEFQNSIALRMPEEYDGDWDQQSLINKWLDDITGEQPAWWGCGVAIVDEENHWQS